MYLHTTFIRFTDRITICQKVPNSYKSTWASKKESKSKSKSKTKESKPIENNDGWIWTLYMRMNEYIHHLLKCYMYEYEHVDVQYLILHFIPTRTVHSYNKSLKEVWEFQRFNGHRMDGEV